MKLLKYIILMMLIWSVPGIFAFDQSLGSLVSYLLYALILLYFFLNPKPKIMIPFVVLGILYFLISGVIYVDDVQYYNQELLKYFILIIGATHLMYTTTIKELFVLLIIGGCSIIANALFFPSDFGRYSGFYFDPNNAGFVCLVGYCLSFAVPSKSLKLGGQFLLTLGGILTFSRTFLLLWLIISLISVFASRKNTVNFGIGIGVIVVLLTIASYVTLNTVRFKAYESLFRSDTDTAISVQRREGSRTDAWAKYYDMISDNPFFGNGFHALRGAGAGQQGVHNTFLMVIGEAGILPFLVIIGIYLSMLVRSFRRFKPDYHLFLLALTLLGILMTVHTYFDNFLILVASMWLFMQLRKDPETEDEPVANEELTPSLDT